MKKLFSVGERLIVEIKPLFKKASTQEVTDWNHYRIHYSKSEFEAINKTTPADDDYYCEWRGLDTTRRKILDRTLFAVERRTEEFTFNDLKERMCADDFIEYCKDRVLPISFIEASQ